ncbi:MAG TPA: hypothetical protein VNY73_05440, partial [Bacteroidia bacterium]|nr:hypothetical protein [Bacteroidia bacterium]
YTTGGANHMDNLNYNYETATNGFTKNTNKLKAAIDLDASTTYAGDLRPGQVFDNNTDHSADNYQYDEIGNLIKDNQGFISGIKWTVYGKIQSVTFVPGHGKNNLDFRYDAGGNRVMKIEHEATDDKITFYTKDAQGNTMATYEYIVPQTGSPTFVLKENDVYGSSRLAVHNRNIDMMASSSSTGLHARDLATKSYETGNHLGNVLAVVSGNEQPIDDGTYLAGVKQNSTLDGLIDYYKAEVVAATDYYSFGMVMPGRQYTSTNYRYGYQGSEKDDEVSGNGNNYTTEFREYDSRLGRWFALDAKSYSFPYLSPYSAMNNNPIFFNDINGDSIPTTFYDQNGVQTNVIPDVVQNMYQKEYGITVGYANGKLYKAGDYQTNEKVSSDAKAEWEKTLGTENTEQSLVFGYDLALSIIPTINGGQLDDEVVMGKYVNMQKTAFIDLADFSKEGQISGSYMIGVGDVNVTSRSDNLARVMEHEFLCHGVMGLTDEGFDGLGAVENQLNIYRTQMGIPLRDSYNYSFESKSKIDLINMTPPTWKVGRSYHDEKGSFTMYYERMKLMRATHYVQNY